MDKQRLTDEQVVKALECCYGSAHDKCRNCPLENVAFCEEELQNLNLDLINRLKAENERLKDFRKDGFFNLLGNCLVYSKNLKDYNDMRKGLKSEAIKEFAERLTGIFGFGELPGTVIKCHIDNLLAELTPTTLNKLPHNSLCDTDTYEGEMK